VRREEGGEVIEEVERAVDAGGSGEEPASCGSARRWRTEEGERDRTG
jgi:hypothetical protein